jgi:hypothetical protein
MPKRKRYRWSDGKRHTRKQRSASQLRAAVEEKRLANDPLLNPAQPLSGGNLKRGADALVGLEFGPQRAALDQESRQIDAQGGALAGRASSYFLDLAKQEMGSVDRMKAIGELAGSQIGAAGTAAQGTLDKVASEAEQLRGQDVAIRGEGLQSTDRLAEELAAARTRSASATQTGQTDAANTMGNYAGLADISRQAREVRGGETVQQILNQIATQQADVRSRRGALEGQVGNATTKALLDLRQQGFENAATAEGLGIDRAELQAQLRQDAQDFSLANRKLRETSRQNRARNRLTEAQIRATRRGQTLSSQTQRRGQDIQAEIQRRNRSSRESIAAANRRAKKGGSARLESADAHKIKLQIGDSTAALQAGKTERWLRKQGAPSIVIKAAKERQAGGLTLATQAELKRLGIRVPKGWRGPQKGPVAP